MKKKEIEIVEEIKQVITLLSIDYPNEGLNDMARKINEIITHINEK